MPLPAAEHQQVKAETRRRRNAGQRRGRAALAYAHAWVVAMEARVIADPTPTGVLYRVRVPGFHEAVARTLPLAVDALDANISTWCDHGLPKGPTGARLDPLCAARRAFLERVK